MKSRYIYTKKIPSNEKERTKENKKEQKKKDIVLSNIILFISTFAIYIFEDVY
jgi:hypothetical protein